MNVLPSNAALIETARTVASQEATASLDKSFILGQMIGKYGNSDIHIAS